MKKDGVLTFSQREGYVELPLPLQIEKLPGAVRIAIWNVLYAQMRESRRRVGKIICIDDPWETILRDLYLYHDNMRLDKWLPTFEQMTTWMQERLEGHRFNQVFDVVEFLMQHDCCPPQFITDLSGVFRRFQLAYTIRPGPQPMILPATTVEEGNELSRNLTELQDAGLDGCETHLRNASKYINEGRWAESVRESIHAVESVAKKINPNATTLAKALAPLEKQGVLQHKALKEALGRLYGYTSDEQGIRHALLDNAQAKVTIDEALFMLGACASFASYLWRKHKAANPP